MQQRLLKQIAAIVFSIILSLFGIIPSVNVYAYNYWPNNAKMINGPIGKVTVYDPSNLNNSTNCSYSYTDIVDFAVDDWNDASYNVNYEHVAYSIQQSHKVYYLLGNYGIDPNSPPEATTLFYNTNGVQYVSNDGAPTGDYAYCIIRINNSLVGQYGYYNFDYTDYRAYVSLFAHELGHTIGLAHNNYENPQWYPVALMHEALYRFGNSGIYQPQNDDISGANLRY